MYLVKLSATSTVDDRVSKETKLLHRGFLLYTLLSLTKTFDFIEIMLHSKPKSDVLQPCVGKPAIVDIPKSDGNMVNSIAPLGI